MSGRRRAAGPTSPCPPAATPARRPSERAGTRRPGTGILVRLLGLDLYASPLLTRKVRIELPRLARLLLAVFLFELVLWSLFWNGAFTGHLGGFSPGWSSLAMLLGLLFAGVVLYFERQALTADVERLPAGSRRIAKLSRLGAIAVAAFITAHPLDVLVFHLPVERHLQAEAVKGEEARLAATIQGMVAAEDVDGERERLRRELSEVVRRRGETSALLATAVGRREALADREGSLSPEVAAMERGVEVGRARYLESYLARPETLRVVADELDRLRSSRRRLDEELRRARQGLAVAQAEVAGLEDDLQGWTWQEASLRQELANLARRERALERARRRLEARLDRWTSSLSRPGPRLRVEEAGFRDGGEGEEGTLWPAEWTRALRFEIPQPDFFSRVRGVYELVFFGSSAAGGSPLDRWVFRGVFVSIHLATLFLPCMVFIVKWYLLSKETDAYFSTPHEAAAGDADARLMLSVERRVRTGEEEW